MGFDTVQAEHAVLLVLWTITVLTCMAAVVQEEQVTSCNTPCDMLQLTCPAGHRLAIREALFSVTARPPSAGPCALTHSCGEESMCCEQSPTQDCVFNYSPSHLEAVHRNCSGMRACVVKTERTQEESVACPFFRPDETISHTVLDYVCINDSATVDICQATETQIVGRTLFTMLDSRRWRDPLGGAVCRCTAESVRWPTTNTIAVFVVDMRLNVLRQSQCSKAEVMLKSGSTTRHLDCVSSRDPRQAFPFIALLNHSNVATVELILHSQLPEFVWIGFESNEVEDIRLSCGLQGYVPIFLDDDDDDNVDDESSDDNTGSGVVTERGNRTPVGAISGGVVGGVLLCVLISVVVFLLVSRRRLSQTKTDDYSEPQDTVDDIDVYYSTPDVNVPNTSINSSGKVKASGAKQKSEANEVDDAEVYVTAEVVRERKRQSGKKRVRIISTPEISDDVAEYYASPWDIRDRRRQEEGDMEVEVFAPELPPQSSLPEASAEGEDYAVLERNRRQANKRHKDDASYDRLTMSQDQDGKQLENNGDNDGEKENCHVEEEDSCNYSFVNNDRPEPDGCNQNAAFEDDEAFG